MSTQKKLYDIKDLIVGLAAGEAQCLEQIYHRYATKIYSVARSFYFSCEDSEEIVQDVFLKVWKNRQKIDVDLSFDSYIITITRNTILNVLRTKSMHKKYVMEVLNNSQSVQNEAEGRLDFQELSRTLDQILQNLSEQRRKVFVSIKLEGYTILDVSKKMGISKRTVEHHLYHAAKFVRDSLEPTIKNR